MFVLARIIALITIFGMPVHLFPTFNNQNAAIVPYPSKNSSPKTIKFPEQFFRHVYNKPLTGKTLKEIQYAPLHVEATIPTSRNVAVANISSSNGKLHKEHLEPRTPDTKKQNTKCYNHPLQHSDVSPTVSRSPGHNAIYKTYPLIIPRDKPFKAHKRSQDVDKKSMPMKKVLKKLNYIKPVQQQLNLVPVTSTTMPLTSKDRSSAAFLANQQYIINPDISDKDIDLGPVNPKLPHLLPFNKLHRIHLNIARVYSPVSQKTPSYSGVYSMNVDSEHAQLQEDLPAILHLSNHHEDKAVKPVSKK